MHRLPANLQCDLSTWFVFPGSTVSVRPGAQSGHPGSVKSSERQNSPGKGLFEFQCIEETATLLRNISRQVPAPEAINHERGRKDLDKGKWNYKRKSVNIWKKNKFWIVFFYVRYCAKCFHWLCPSVLEIIYVKYSIQVLVHGRVLQDSSGHYYYYD